MEMNDFVITALVAFAAGVLILYAVLGSKERLVSFFIRTIFALAFLVSTYLIANVSIDIYKMVYGASASTPEAVKDFLYECVHDETLITAYCIGVIFTIFWSIHTAFELFGLYILVDKLKSKAGTVTDSLASRRP